MQRLAGVPFRMSRPAGSSIQKSPTRDLGSRSKRRPSRRDDECYQQNRAHSTSRWPQADNRVHVDARIQETRAANDSVRQRFVEPAYYWDGHQSSGIPAHSRGNAFAHPSNPFHQAMNTNSYPAFSNSVRYAGSNWQAVSSQNPCLSGTRPLATWADPFAREQRHKNYSTASSSRCQQEATSSGRQRDERPSSMRAKSAESKSQTAPDCNHDTRMDDKFDALTLPGSSKKRRTENTDRSLEGGVSSLSVKDRKKLNVLKNRLWQYTEFGRAYKRKPPSRHDSFRFTVIDYNVLAQDLLEDNEYLYRGCHSDALTWEFRKQNLLREIGAITGDIFCLQEVQADHFESFYKPEMAKRGFKGVFVQRTGNKCDGCATFVRQETFELTSVHPVRYLREGCSVLDRDNVGLVTVVTPIVKGRAHPEKRLCVGNTHLLFNPRRGDIKLLQIGMLLAELDKQAFRGIRDGENVYSPVILCGDFNAKPFSPLYNMLVHGSIEYNGLQAAYVAGNPEQMIRNPRMLDKSLITPSSGISQVCQYLDIAKRRYEAFDESKRDALNDTTSGRLGHVLKLKSVYDHNIQTSSRQCLREVTTHHGRTSCTVDYIFHNGTNDTRERRGSKSGGEELRLIAKLGLMTDRDMKVISSLPNEVVSSDHLMLGAKFCLALR